MMCKHDNRVSKLLLCPCKEAVADLEGNRFLNPSAMSAHHALIVYCWLDFTFSSAQLLSFERVRRFAERRSMSVDVVL